MQTATMKNHDYAGPTRAAHQDKIDRLTHRFAHVNGPHKLRPLLAIWGLSEPTKKS